MKDESVKLHEYYVCVERYQDFRLVLDRVNDAGLNSRNWISIASYPKVKYLFISLRAVSLDVFQICERATRNADLIARSELTPKGYVDMIDTYISQKKEKMKKLTIEQVYVHVPFVAITDVLLEAAKINDLEVSNYISTHDYLFCSYGQIEGSNNKEFLLSNLKEVGVNEFMQLILDQNKSVSVMLNDKIEVFISNKGSNISYSFNKQAKEKVSDSAIDMLKSFLEHKETPNFQAGEYCAFPSSSIRRAFAKLVNLSNVRGADIIENQGPETVLFYEPTSFYIWLKKDEAAYRSYDLNAKKLTMEEFADRLQPKKLLTMLNHPVTKVGTIVKIGCQDIQAVDLDELFCVIAEQRGEAKAMAS